MRGGEVVGAAAMMEVAGEPATRRFVVDIPGILEVETERAGTPLLELSVG